MASSLPTRSFFQAFTHDLFCVGIEAVPPYACYEAGDDYRSFTYAGFDGLDLPEHEKEEPYILHFPDGNAPVVKLLVRSLIPGAVPGNTMEEVVTVKVDYSQLDRAGASAYTDVAIDQACRAVNELLGQRGWFSGASLHVTHPKLLR
jgi:hypothetical protein